MNESEANLIRVLLHILSPALRAGLAALLSSDRTIKVVNEALDEQNEADVVITSASSFHHKLGDSASAATLFLGDDQLNVEEMRRTYRVWGVLPTDSSPEELTAAIHALSQGLIVGTPTWGQSASYFITLLLSEWMIRPSQTHPWVADYLGLGHYPLVARDLADRNPTARPVLRATQSLMRLGMRRYLD